MLLQSRWSPEKLLWDGVRAKVGVWVTSRRETNETEKTPICGGRVLSRKEKTMKEERIKIVILETRRRGLGV